MRVRHKPALSAAVLAAAVAVGVAGAARGLRDWLQNLFFETNEFVLVENGQAISFEKQI